MITGRILMMYHDLTLIAPSYAVSLCEITTNNKALSSLRGTSRESIRIDRYFSSALHTQPLFHRLFFVKRTPLYWTCASKVALDLSRLSPSLFLYLLSLYHMPLNLGPYIFLFHILISSTFHESLSHES